MKALYVESSAVIAWLFNEPAAAGAAEKIDRAEVVVTSALTIAEVERALRRAASEGTIKEADARKLHGSIQRRRAAWVVMAVTESVLARAGRAFPVEPVRTLDAIHLATALAFTEALPDLAILTLDRRVAGNATALGLDAA